MKTTKIVSVGVIICLFIMWFFPYVRYEYLTWKYGTEFVGLQKTTNMIDEVYYFKVLDYSKDCARVYYVGGSGNILTFIRDSEEWALASWETVWSVSGSADSFIWPYFYHSPEGLCFVFIISAFLIFLISILIFIAKTIKQKVKAH